MSFFHNKAALTPAVVAFATVVSCTGMRQPESVTQQAATLNRLGTVEFPTSCSPEAQTRFVRGVAALHSFWYPVALQEFRAATQIDPGCTMGYWGEAMAHNHPIWGDPQETQAARKVIEKIRTTLS